MVLAIAGLSVDFKVKTSQRYPGEELIQWFAQMSYKCQIFMCNPPSLCSD